MKIPSQIEIADSKIKVVWDKNLHFREDCVGLSEYRLNKITLSPNCPEWPLSQEEIENSFIHEMLHFCLKKMEHELRSDEKFVGMLAGLLTQAMRSGKII